MRMIPVWTITIINPSGAGNIVNVMTGYEIINPNMPDIFD